MLRVGISTAHRAKRPLEVSVSVQLTRHYRQAGRRIGFTGTYAQKDQEWLRTFVQVVVLPVTLLRKARLL